MLADYPIRNPADRILKRDGRRVDADNVCVEFGRNGKELSDVNYEGRTRFQDIIAVALNTRRAIRELLLPELQQLKDEVAALRSALGRVGRQDAR